MLLVRKLVLHWEAAETADKIKWLEISTELYHPATEGLKLALCGSGKFLKDPLFRYWMKNLHGTDLNLKQAQPNPSSQDCSSSPHIRNNIHQVWKTPVSTSSPPVMQTSLSKPHIHPAVYITRDLSLLRLKAEGGKCTAPCQHQRTYNTTAPAGARSWEQQGLPSQARQGVRPSSLTWSLAGVSSLAWVPQAGLLPCSSTVQCLTGHLLIQMLHSPPSTCCLSYPIHTPDHIVNHHFQQCTAFLSRFAAHYLQFRVISLAS